VQEIKKTLFMVANKIIQTTGDCSLPSYSSATELAERFNRFFLTIIERICHEIDSEVADGPIMA